MCVHAIGWHSQRPWRQPLAAWRKSHPRHGQRGAVRPTARIADDAPVRAIAVQKAPVLLSRWLAAHRMALSFFDRSHTTPPLVWMV